MLDLGTNIGSFTLYALERGCHVISFDMLLENILSVLQTLNRAVAADGRLYLERWHGFWNGVRFVQCPRSLLNDILCSRWPALGSIS